MHATFNFHEWHEFSLLIGTVAGALVALLFVAVSISVGYLTEERTIANRFFLTPIVIHFSGIVFISALALAPEKYLQLIEILIGLNALAGVIVAAVVFYRVWSMHFAGVYLVDHLGYGLGPLVSYAVILAAAICAFRDIEWSAYLLGGGVVLLLMVNIRNAWDMMLSLVRRAGQTRNES
jgi:hypothetical protein